jgi:tetratricopeptide (TPR) repeat protein
VELLLHATELDPDFALAHARLALVFWEGRISHRYPPMDSALARAERAVEASPALPEALAARGYLLASANQFDRARADLRQALELNPNLGLAWGGLAAAGWWSGDPVAGALAARRGVRVDPLDLATTLHLSYNLGHLGMYREGAAWAKRVLETRPGDMYSLQLLCLYAFASGDSAASRTYREQMVQAGGRSPYVLYTAALVELGNGHLDAATQALRQVVTVQPTMSINGTPTAQALLAWAEHRQAVPGARERLEEVMTRRVKESAEWPGVTPFADLALLAAARGDADAAVGWFQEAIRRDHIGTLYVFLRDFPIWDPIRDRPQFQTWLRDSEERLAAGCRALAAFGGWMPEDILGGLQP